MRKSTWTPSIVPDHTDHNFYLVMDRLDPDTTIFHERVVETTDLENVITDMLSGQIVIRCAFSPSIQLKSGPRTYLKTLPVRFNDDAISSSWMCRVPFKVLLMTIWGPSKTNNSR